MVCVCVMFVVGTRVVGEGDTTADSGEFADVDER